MDSGIKFGTVHQPIRTWSYPNAPAIPSPLSHLLSQYIPTRGHASAGVHLHSRHHPPHSGPHSYPRYHSLIHPKSYFPTGVHASAGVHLHSRHHQSHSDPQYHPPIHPTHYAHDRGYLHVHTQPMHHSSQSGSRRPSARGGPLVADFHINPALVYPSHPNPEPTYTHTKSILRNRGDPLPAPVVSPNMLALTA